MTPPDFGVTPQGFKIMRLIEAKTLLENLFTNEFSEINLEAQSVAGQIIGIFAKVIADDWENLQDVYLSQYPNSASGVSLDNVVQLNGLTRIPASRTTVTGVATGVNGTLIHIGSLASIPSNGAIFQSTANAFITNGNAVANTVQVTSATAQVYTVLINGVSYIYSLPTLTFSGPIVSGNSINVRINGISMPTVNYATSSAATLGNLASQIMINASDSVASATVVGNTIELVPVLGQQIIADDPVVSGVGAPTGSVTLRTPTLAGIAQYLAARVNTGNNLSASWTNLNTFFTISATDTSFPYSINLGSNLQVTSVSSPVPFQAQEYGPIPVPAGTLTNILTPIAGWNSLTNYEAGITGRNQETDAELRLRRQSTLRGLGFSTVESLLARIPEVPGVTAVLVFENVTMTQDPIEINFSSDFVSGNSVIVNFEGNNIGTVNYVSSNLQVMNDIRDLFLTQSEIKTAIVSGAGNHTLTLTMEDGQDVIVAFSISPIPGSPTYTLAGGRPPKSFEAVVQGGTDAAVALKIWQLKPAGIMTFGNTHVNITDSQGNTQGINFTRAIPVYIWATVALTVDGNFPVNGQSQVANAILTYGNTLGIGVDVYIQRVQAAVFAVPGVISATVQLARTLNLSDTPVYGSTDIAIAETEISTWALGRINVSI